MHRFFIAASDRELRQELWIDDKELVHQWQKVLRFQEGDELILFDEDTEKMYRIDRAEPTAYRLQHVTDLVRKLPKRHIYLFWSLLKKDKNDWVLQKCTELGVSNFVPIISERTENTQFDEERSKKIITEAVEQCGRSDIPYLHEPMSLQQAVETYTQQFPLLFAHMTSDTSVSDNLSNDKIGICIGPEGGWNSEEMDFFNKNQVQPINLAEFTLRAETACVAAVALLMQQP